MKLLLDTHIVEWSLNGDPKLSQQTAELIRAPGNEVVLSVVVLWEIAIKRNLSRRGPNGFSHSAEEPHDLMLKSGALILPVTPAHAFAVEAPPPLHRDPFDRLLVAQALAEPLRLVTHDPQIAAYSDTVILV